MADAFDVLLGAANGGPVDSPAPELVPLGAGDASAHAMGYESGAYDAADRFDQSLAMWGAPLQSADADILPDKDIVDGRSRDMLRNDALVQGGSTLRKNSVVGAQYLLNSRPATRALWGKPDDTWEQEFQEEVEETFDLVAESPECYLDAERKKTFTEIIRLGLGVHLAGGEILATAEYYDDGRPFRTGIQMVDPDRLSTAPTAMVDPNVRAGIRYDQRGAPLAYQIRTQHPNDYQTWGFKLPEWTEVPIRKPWGRLQVIHIFEQMRVDQSRGISELVTSLREQKFVRKFRDSNLQRAIMQSLFAAAITSELPPETVFAQMGGAQMTPEACASAINNYATAYLGEISKYVGSAKGIRLDGVRIPHFYPGTKLQMMSPSNGLALGMDFEASLNRYIAASIGVSYEQFSRDYSQTNYSSAKAGGAEADKFMAALKKLIADKFAHLIFRLWLEEAINKNVLTTFPANKAPLLYTNGRLNLKFDAISRCDWVGASKGQIDELKETQAAVLRINNGLSTAEDELARLGKDWRKVYRQLKREQVAREAEGLMFVANDPATQAQINALSATPTDEPKKAA